MEFKLYSTQHVFPDRLIQINNSLGGTTTIEYVPSTRFNNKGSDEISDLGHPMAVIKSITEDNGMESRIHHTSGTYLYDYKAELYDYAEKEFRGFGEVDVTDPAGNVKEYQFFQDDALKGILRAHSTKDKNDTFYAATFNSWVSTVNPGGYYETYLSSVMDYTFDGGSVADMKTKYKEFNYDIYGNIIRTTYHGDLVDARSDYNIYTYNTTCWLVDKVAHTYSTDSMNNKTREHLYFYDNHSLISDPPEKGDLTRSIDWLDTGESPEIKYIYDDHGNVILKTNARGYATRYEYDPTNTFPIRITYAKNQTSIISYDPRNGKLLSKTDPNDFTTSYFYDAFGRIKNEFRPGDSEYPSVKYEYHLDGSAPEGIKVSQKISGFNYSDKYTLIDGQARVIQERSGAENEAHQIISDTFYDNLGNVKRESIPYEGNLSENYTNPAASRERSKNGGYVYDYEPMGRVIRVRNLDASISPREIIHDCWKTTVIDENGHSKIYFQDAFDRIIKVEEINKGQTYSPHSAVSVHPVIIFAFLSQQQ